MSGLQVIEVIGAAERAGEDVVRGVGSRLSAELTDTAVALDDCRDHAPRELRALRSLAVVEPDSLDRVCRAGTQRRAAGD